MARAGTIATGAEQGRRWALPQEAGIVLVLIGIALVFELLGWALRGQSFLGNPQSRTLQIATLLRLVASVWPAHSAVLSTAAAVTWTVVWVLWAARFLPVLLRPRRDGRAG